MIDDFDFQELIRTWVAECEENLASMEEMLLVLEKAPENDEALNTIFRAAHTLKGSSASVGHAHIAAFAHRMEDLLERLRARSVAVTNDCMTLLLRSVDVLRQMIPEALRGSTEIPPDGAALMEQLEAVSQTRQALSSPIAESTPLQAEAVSRTVRKLRIDLEKLDQMLNLAGETAIGAGRLERLIHQLEDSARETLIEAWGDLQRLLGEMQERVTRIRMVPVGPRLEQHLRIVRDMAQSRHKEMRLVVESGDVEMDASLVEQIKDPLMHMIRNAVDHGVEAPDVRAGQGKDPVATITLTAAYEGGGVSISVSDDGAGFRRKKIVERARATGLISADATPDGDDILRLVFAPGFSTAEEVSETSGRGVGMDVVQRNISALRGTVTIRSEEGAGSTLTMRLPLTLAIIEGLAVQAGKQKFVIPMQAVEECVRLDTTTHLEGGAGVIDHRGRPLPFVRLRHMFGVDGGGRAATRENLVLVRAGEGMVAIVADELLGQMQAVIKPMGKLFQKVAGVAGSTIFSDGGIGFILDVPGLVHRMAGRDRAEEVSSRLS